MQVYLRRWTLCTVFLCPMLASAATHTVTPGQRIQPVLDRAQAGDVIQLDAATYTERLTIRRDGITVQGRAGTILDGSEPTSGWTPIGSGVWKADLGYVPYAMTTGGRTLWRLSDRAMGGERLFGTDGTGMQALQRPASALHNSIRWWDGVGALFGVQGRTTYVRFADGASPATRQVRATPREATITVDGANNVTIKGLTIVGGYYGVLITGGATRTTLEDSRIRNGYVRVMVKQASQTTIRNNDIRMHGLMTTQYQPGDWNDTSYGRKVSGVMYAVNKFFVGDTRENDQNIEVYHATDTTIEGNTITEGLVGIELRESQRTRILGNTISHHAAQGIWAYEGGEAEVAHNLFLDNDHHMRVQMNAGPPKKLYIYANRFHQAMAGDSAKHIHLSFVGCSGQSCSSPGIVAVYHNSFAGGGWAVDLGGTNEGRKDTPGLQILNNLLSVRGLSSGGYHSTGEVQTKLTAPLWRSDSVPTFVLPAGHAGRDSAPSLVGKLPGMTSAYIGDGKPNYGAVQDNGSTTAAPAPAPPPLPVPTNLRVIAAP